MELVLAAPVFFALFLAVVDYGWLYAHQAGLDEAAITACRAGSLVDPARSSPVQVARTALRERASIFCRGEACTFAVEDLRSGAYAIPNRTLECTVTMEYSPLVGFIPTPDLLSSTSYDRLKSQR